MQWWFCERMKEWIIDFMKELVIKGLHEWMDDWFNCMSEWKKWIWEKLLKDWGNEWASGKVRG